MLTTGSSTLAPAFLFVVLLALVVMTRSGWHAKLVAGGALALFTAVAANSTPGLLGWPAGEEPPARFRLLAAHVQQPDKQTGSEGAVFLWAIDAEDMSRTPEPRAYRLPYSPALHETAAGASAKLGKGVAQLGEFAGTLPAGNWFEHPGDGKQAAMSMKFYDVPDPLYPEG